MSGETRPALLDRDGTTYKCPWCWRRLRLTRFPDGSVVRVEGWVQDGDRWVWRKPHHRTRAIVANPAGGPRTVVGQTTSTPARPLPTPAIVVCPSCGDLADLA